MATTTLSEMIVKSIYGDVDLREFGKALDPSDVHVNGNVPAPTTQQAKDSKKLAATGLAATGVAGIAGVHAVSATRKENAARAAAATASVGRHAADAPEKIGHVTRTLRATGLSPSKTAAVIGGAALGLHAVELVGDSLGAHAQIKSIRASNQQLNKAFRLKPLNAEVAARAHSLRAKRPKMNPLPPNPSSVNGLHQPVNKKLGGVRRIIRNVEDITESGKKTAGHATNAAQDAAVTAHKIKRLVPSRTAAAGIGAGAIGGIGAADYSARNAANKSAEKRYFRAQGQVEKSVTWTGTFSKVDDDKRQVFGWASVSEINGKPVVDLQGDIVPIDEIEKSAYKYVLESRKGGDMHARLGKSLFSGDQPKHTSDMIESFVVTPEKLSKMGLPEDSLPLGWWVGFHVNDDQQWADVKSGNRAGFSIHGSGTRTPVDSVSKMGTHRKEPGDRAQVPGRRRALDMSASQHAVAVAPKQPWSMVAPKHSSSKIVRHVNRVKAVSQKAGVHLALMEDRGPLVAGIARELMGKAAPTLRERASQAIHPPAVKLKPVNSSFITGLGYQKQTHRLAYKMGSGDKTRRYAYRVKPQAAARVLRSPSPGKAYNTDVRNTAKRAKHYTPADRVRLFADPQVSKAATPAPTGTTALPPTPPAQPVAKPTKKPLKLVPASTPVIPPVNGS